MPYPTIEELQADLVNVEERIQQCEEQDDVGSWYEYLVMRRRWLTQLIANREDYPTTRGLRPPHRRNDLWQHHRPYIA